MDEFGGAGADDVDAEELAGLLVDEHFEHADGVAEELAAGNFAVLGDAGFVGDAGVGELFFIFSDHGDFGDGVDAVGEELGDGGGFDAEGVTGGEAALFHGDRGEGGETDDIAGGVDVGGVGLEMGVDLQAFAIVSDEAGVFELEGFGGALSADGVEEALGGEAFAGFEMGLDEFCAVVGGGVTLFDFGDFFTEAEGDADLAHLILERFGDFTVEEVEEFGFALDEGDADAEGAQHAGVFDADDAAADDDDGFGEGFEFEESVGGEDGVIVKGDGGWHGGSGAGGDDEFFGGEHDGVVGLDDLEEIGAFEVCVAPEEVDAVAIELFADDGAFIVDDVLGDVDEVFEGDIAFDAEVVTEEGAFVGAGEVEDGFAEGFGGDGAGVDAGSAEDGVAFNDADGFFEFGGLDGGFLSSGAGADDSEIVVFHAIARTFLDPLAGTYRPFWGGCQTGNGEGADRGAGYSGCEGIPTKSGLRLIVMEGVSLWFDELKKAGQKKSGLARPWEGTR